MNLLRGILRLIAFLGITFFQVSRLFLWRSIAFTEAAQRNAAWKSLAGWSRLCSRLLNIRIEYQGELPVPGSMVLPNHRSYIDIVPFPPLLELCFVAKAEVGAWPLIGSGARLVGTVFVDRSSKESRRHTREAMGHFLAQGRSVIVFTEGTTYAAPELGELRPGMYHLAAEGGFSVVPVAIEYLDPRDAWVGKDTFVPHFLRCFSKPSTGMVVRFGPVMEGQDGDLLREQVAEWLRKNLAEIRESHRIPA